MYSFASITCAKTAGSLTLCTLVFLFNMKTLWWQLGQKHKKTCDSIVIQSSFAFFLKDVTIWTWYTLIFFPQTNTFKICRVSCPLWNFYQLSLY